MTVAMAWNRKHGEPRAVVTRVFSAVVMVTALTAGVVGHAPEAAADEAQSKQWYLEAMDAEKIWKSTTGKGIKVAIIDSGVNPNIASLKNQVLKGADLTGTPGDETDDYSGHGTTMAELIVGTGAGGGLQGLAPGAKVIPMRVNDTDRQNKMRVNAFDVEQAIKAAADSDAQIINVSMSNDFYSSQVRDAVKYAQAKGKLLFAGAGNGAEEGNKPQYPASYPEAISVAAGGSDGQIAPYSQHNKYVDLAAPGSDIPGWCNASFKSYCDAGGTSNATALASASAALIWSAHPEWTGNQVLRVMLESAGRGGDGNKKGLSEYYGYGVVRPGAHINRGLGKPGDPNVNPLTNERVGDSSDSSASPKPSAPASSQPPKPKPGSNAAVKGSSSESSDGSGQLGLVLGAIAAAVVIGGGAFAVVRKRRSA
ncbi:S8 family serine peptidase [Streptomyces sp. NPDC006208]|uniref:S8 family serine peptidase n=1 Tax=Streptomyces sp. NPDC006208 TaxID=3156734 RepID=UPI0033A62474